MIWQKRLRFGVVAAVVLGGAVAASSQQASADQSPRASASTEDLEHWAQVRNEFGFRHDAAYLNQVAQADGLTSRDIGVPLTPIEASEMTRRGDLGQLVGKITQLGKPLDTFGGVWVDQESGGVLDVGVVGSGDAAAQLKDTINALVPDEDPLAFVAVQYSAARIDQIVDSVRNDFASKKLSAYGVVQIGSDTQKVKLSISASAPTSAESDLHALYPQKFVEISRLGDDTGYHFNSRNRTSGKLYGGEWAIDEDGGKCSLGFSRMVGSTTGNLFTVTAGHCDYRLSWHQGKNYAAGNGFGEGYARNGTLGSYSHGTTQKCECQIIGPIPSSAATNKTFVENEDLYEYWSTPQNTPSYYYKGRTVCESGAAYADSHGGDINCGTILDVNYGIYFEPNDVTFIYLVAASMEGSIDGDSGAPVGSGHDFMGIHNGTTNLDHSFFSRSVYLDVTTNAHPEYVITG